MKKAEIEAMNKRVSEYRRLNTFSYYVVTFDLKDSAGRTGCYAAFKSRLEHFLKSENTHRIIKQCYFVKSDFHPRDIRTEMQNSLLPQDSILVARLQSGQSWSLKTPGAGRRAKQYFEALKEDESGL